MSKMKRLIAVCIAAITIPAFTIGDAPYGVAKGTDRAYAVSFEEGPIRPTFMVHKNVEFNRLALRDEVRATTMCGTEKTTTSTETTSTSSTTTTTVTTTTVTTTTTEVQTEPPVETEPETEVTETETETTGETEFVWEGKKLNIRDGTVPAGQTPSGLKETFYNLPMFGCLDLIGFSHDGYAETEDGFKTYNGYIMVASPDLSRWPKGSYIETTNGMGIVVDFCPAGNLDVAVTWVV